MISDIEDTFVDLQNTRIPNNQITPNIKSHSSSLINPSLISSPDSFLPGNYKIFIKTWGCSHNNSDGEYMAGLLSSHGYQIFYQDDQKHSCHLWILNSCTVKGPSEQTFINEINSCIQSGKKIIVSGCVPQASPLGDHWKSLSIIGVQQINHVVYVVEETLKGNTVKLLKNLKTSDPVTGKKRKDGGAPLDLPKVRRNPFIEIIPINTGCLNQCTYCKTKHARGDLGSYQPSEIIDRVNSVLSENVMEIWLTSEDTGAYGIDIGTDIVVLLQKIVTAMENHENQDAMLRIGMTNPPYILGHLEEIAKILSHPRVYSFLHVPIQSGSNKVLDDMRRLYTREEFMSVVDYLYDNVKLPGSHKMTIATDVICGFPTESLDDFEDTMEILKKYQFPILHISQFYPRPGTPAALLPKIRSDKIKDRSRTVTRFFESYTTYDDLPGSTLKVLVTERSADGLHYVAHDKAYRQVLVPQKEELMGRWVTIKVLKTGKYFIMAENDISEKDMHATCSISNDINRMPKLVRGAKGLINVQNKDSNDDGSELSMGSRAKASTESKFSYFDVSNINFKFVIGISVTILAISLQISNIRWSFQLAIIFFTIAGLIFLQPDNR